MGVAQREQAVEQTAPSGVDKAVPMKVRAKFPEKRRALAAKFAELPANQRPTRAAEFSKLLRQVCASDLEHRGYWQLKFEPLLTVASGPSNQRSGPAKSSLAVSNSRRLKPSRAEHAATEAAILAFVRKQSGRLTQKDCVLTLCGVAEGARNARALQDVPEFGHLRAVPLETVHARVASMVSRRLLNKHPTTGKLSVSRGT